MARVVLDMGVALVRGFHAAFRLEYPREPEVAPIGAEAVEAIRLARTLFKLSRNLKERSAELGGSRLLIRLQLMTEELAEVAEAISLDDTLGTLHEMADLSYVVDGTWDALGMGDLKSDAMAEVHRANMSKLDANGNPIISAAGRVMKSDLFRKADLSHLLEDE